MAKVRAYSTVTKRNIGSRLKKVDDYIDFKHFIELYYKWVEERFIDDVKDETDVKGQYFTLDSLETMMDIDKCSERFLHYYKESLAKGFAEETKADFRKVLKTIGDLFRAKGTDRAVKYFFRAVYGKESSIEYPINDLFTPSASRWFKENVIYIYNPNNYPIDYFKGKLLYAVATDSNGQANQNTIIHPPAQCYIESAEPYEYDDVHVRLYCTDFRGGDFEKFDIYKIWNDQSNREILLDEKGNIRKDVELPYTLFRVSKQIIDWEVINPYRNLSKNKGYNIVFNNKEVIKTQKYNKEDWGSVRYLHNESEDWADGDLATGTYNVAVIDGVEYPVVNNRITYNGKSWDVVNNVVTIDYVNEYYIDQQFSIITDGDEKYITINGDYYPVNNDVLSSVIYDGKKYIVENDCIFLEDNTKIEVLYTVDTRYVVIDDVEYKVNDEDILTVTYNNKKYVFNDGTVTIDVKIVDEKVVNVPVEQRHGYPNNADWGSVEDSLDKIGEEIIIQDGSDRNIDYKEHSDENTLIIGNINYNPDVFTDDVYYYGEYGSENDRYLFTPELCKYIRDGVKYNYAFDDDPAETIRYPYYFVEFKSEEELQASIVDGVATVPVVYTVPDNNTQIEVTEYLVQGNRIYYYDKDRTIKDPRPVFRFAPESEKDITTDYFVGRFSNFYNINSLFEIIENDETKKIFTSSSVKYFPEGVTMRDAVMVNGRFYYIYNAEYTKAEEYTKQNFLSVFGEVNRLYNLFKKNQDENVLIYIKTEDDNHNNILDDHKAVVDGVVYYYGTNEDISDIRDRFQFSDAYISFYNEQPLYTVRNGEEQEIGTVLKVRVTDVYDDALSVEVMYDELFRYKGLAIRNLNFYIKTPEQQVIKDNPNELVFPQEYIKEIVEKYPPLYITEDNKYTTDIELGTELEYKNWVNGFVYPDGTVCYLGFGELKKNEDGNYDFSESLFNSASYSEESGLYEADPYEEETVTPDKPDEEEIIYKQFVFHKNSSNGYVYVYYKNGEEIGRSGTNGYPYPPSGMFYVEDDEILPTYNLDYQLVGVETTIRGKLTNYTIHNNADDFQEMGEAVISNHGPYGKSSGNGAKARFHTKFDTRGTEPYQGSPVESVDIYNGGSLYDRSVSIIGKKGTNIELWGYQVGGAKDVNTTFSMCGISPSFGDQTYHFKDVGDYVPMDENYSEDKLEYFHTKQEYHQRTPIIKPVVGNILQTTGYFDERLGIIGESSFIQDFHYYQLFSYVLTVENSDDDTLNKEDYIDLYKKFLHPAGYKMFERMKIMSVLMDGDKIKRLGADILQFIQIWIWSQHDYLDVYDGVWEPHEDYRKTYDIRPKLNIRQGLDVQYNDKLVKYIKGGGNTLWEYVMEYQPTFEDGTTEAPAYPLYPTEHYLHPNHYILAEHGLPPNAEYHEGFWYGNDERVWVGRVNTSEVQGKAEDPLIMINSQADIIYINGVENTDTRIPLPKTSDDKHKNFVKIVDFPKDKDGNGYPHLGHSDNRKINVVDSISKYPDDTRISAYFRAYNFDDPSKSRNEKFAMDEPLVRTGTSKDGYTVVPYVQRCKLDNPLHMYLINGDTQLNFFYEYDYGIGTICWWSKYATNIQPDTETSVNELSLSYSIDTDIVENVDNVSLPLWFVIGNFADNHLKYRMRININRDNQPADFMIIREKIVVDGVDYFVEPNLDGKGFAVIIGEDTYSVVGGTVTIGDVEYKTETVYDEDGNIELYYPIYKGNVTEVKNIDASSIKYGTTARVEFTTLLEPEETAEIESITFYKNSDETDNPLYIITDIDEQYNYAKNTY